MVFTGIQNISLRCWLYFKKKSAFVINNQEITKYWKQLPGRSGRGSHWWTLVCPAYEGQQFRFQGCVVLWKQGVSAHKYFCNLGSWLEYPALFEHYEISMKGKCIVRYLIFLISGPQRLTEQFI